MNTEFDQENTNQTPYPDLPPLIESRETEYWGTGITSSVAIAGTSNSSHYRHFSRCLSQWGGGGRYRLLVDWRLFLGASFAVADRVRCARRSSRCLDWLC